MWIDVTSSKGKLPSSLSFVTTSTLPCACATQEKEECSMSPSGGSSNKAAATALIAAAGLGLSLAALGTLGAAAFAASELSRPRRRGKPLTSRDWCVFPPPLFFLFPVTGTRPKALYPWHPRLTPAHGHTHTTTPLSLLPSLLILFFASTGTPRWTETGGWATAPGGA